MASIFTQIINGDIPCHKLAEDDRYLSFLDIRPVHTGHALVIPKKEIDYIFDLDDDLLGGLLLFARPIARAIEKIVPCARVGLVVAGIEVPHAHVHLIPFTEIADIKFENARPAEHPELAKLAESIRGGLA